MIEALMSLPRPIIDKKHNLEICFENDRARSNESRFEHIVKARHGLKPNDLKRIPRHIKKSILKIDSERDKSFSMYIRRNNYSNEYIKISLRIEPDNPKKAIVKTMFITQVVK